MLPHIIAIVGRSGVGKTYLLESLLRCLRSKGFKVATIKHTHHQVFTDESGTDTDRHLRAGARVSALSGPGFCTFFQDGEMPFEQLVQAAGWGVDLVLVEGFKTQQIRKIEVVRGEEPTLPAEERWMTVTSDQTSEVAEAVFAVMEKTESSTDDGKSDDVKEKPQGFE